MRTFILVAFWLYVFSMCCRLFVVLWADDSEKKINSMLHMVMAMPFAVWAGILLWA